MEHLPENGCSYYITPIQPRQEKACKRAMDLQKMIFSENTLLFFHFPDKLKGSFFIVKGME